MGYFNGRDAFVYLEERQIQSLRDVFPNFDITISGDKEKHEFTIHGDISSWEYIVDDVSKFLSEHSKQRWVMQESLGDIMHEMFVNEHGRGLSLDGHKLHGRTYHWRLEPAPNFYHPNPVNAQEFAEISEAYLKYLGIEK